MTHQYMPKILHGPHENPPAPPPTYLMCSPLDGNSLKVLYNLQYYPRP